MSDVQQTGRGDARWAVRSWAMVWFALALSVGVYLVFMRYRLEAVAGSRVGGGYPLASRVWDLLVYTHPALVLVFFRLATPDDRFAHIAASIGSAFLAAVTLVVVLPSTVDDRHGGDGAFILIPLAFFCCYFALVAAVRVALRRGGGDRAYLCRLFGLVMGPPLAPFLLLI